MFFSLSCLKGFSSGGCNEYACFTRSSITAGFFLCLGLIVSLFFFFFPMNITTVMGQRGFEPRSTGPKPVALSRLCYRPDRLPGKHVLFIAIYSQVDANCLVSQEPVFMFYAPKRGEYPVKGDILGKSYVKNQMYNDKV